MLFRSSIDQLKLVLDGQHLAEASDGSVKFEGGLRIGESGFSLKSNGFISFASDPSVIINIDTFFNSDRTQFFDDCVHRSCLLNGSSMDYEIVVDKHMLLGKLKCSQAQCNLRNIDHEISTEHTKAFFSAVTDTKIFNPLLLLAVYSQILGGLPNGNGHALILQ